VALDVRDGSKKWVTQINPDDVWNYAFRTYDPETGRYLDCSIGDTPKIYSVDIEGRQTKVVGVGCKNGAFYVLHASDGRVFQHTPVYNGTPTDPPNPTPDPRTLALPSSLGGLQTGCACDGRSVYVNGLDWLMGLGSTIAEPPLTDMPPPTGGRVTSISLDTRTENWRYETPLVRHDTWKGQTVGDPVGSGLAIANGVVYFTTVLGHKLVALDASSGKELFTYTLPDLTCGPSVSNGKVYVGVGECVLDLKIDQDLPGGVFCFGLPAGSAQ
jgi:outer membrane protein assembly factor BamB